MTQPSSAVVTLSAHAAGLKELFPQFRVEQVAYRDRDLLRWLPKADNFVGYDVEDGGAGWYHIPVRYDKPQGNSAFFASSQATTSSGKVKSFKLPRKRYYGYLTIDEELAAASRNRDGSFYSPKEADTEDLIANTMEILETALWRGSGGALGEIASGGISTTTITLADPSDIINFSVGMTIGFNTANDGSGTDKGDAVTTVTAVNIGAGTITTADDMSDDTATVEAGHFIFRAGSSTDVSATGDAGNMPVGIPDWIPYTAESAGTFLGASRTDRVEHLQGWRKADQGSIEETIKALMTDMMRHGARPDTIWMSYNSWFRLEAELGSRANREDGKPATFGLPSLTYASPRGPMKVMPAAYCPDNRFYLLKRSSWKFLHLNALPHIVMTDGTRYRVMTGADAMELRVRWWGNLACFAPFHNGVGQIS